jgi:hypothetical protein
MMTSTMDNSESGSGSAEGGTSKPNSVAGVAGRLPQGRREATEAGTAIDDEAEAAGDAFELPVLPSPAPTPSNLASPTGSPSSKPTPPASHSPALLTPTPSPVPPSISASKTPVWPTHVPYRPNSAKDVPDPATEEELANTAIVTMAAGDKHAMLVVALLQVRVAVAVIRQLAWRIVY